MDIAALAPLVTGTGGALVVLLVWIYAIAQGEKSAIGMAPAYVVKGVNERNRILEEENDELNTAVITLSKENAGMEARLDGLTHEQKRLRDEIKQLRKDVRDAGV